MERSARSLRSAGRRAPATADPRRARGKGLRPILRRWPDADALGGADVDELSAVIGSLGLAKRAETLRPAGRSTATSQARSHRARVLSGPSGVGPYVAHAVPIFARGRNLPLADWVIARVLRGITAAMSGGGRTATRTFGTWRPDWRRGGVRGNFGSAPWISQPLCVSRVRDATSALCARAASSSSAAATRRRETAADRTDIFLSWALLPAAGERSAWHNGHPRSSPLHSNTSSSG